MDNTKTDQEIRMFAVQQMAVIFKGCASVPYHFLPCAEILAQYIKSGNYPPDPNEEDK